MRLNYINRTMDLAQNNASLQKQHEFEVPRNSYSAGPSSTGSVLEEDFSFVSNLLTFIAGLYNNPLYR